MDQAQLKHAEKHFQWGLFYAEKDNLEAALKEFNLAIRINPKHIWAYIERAAVYIDLQKPNEVLKNCNTALGLNPTPPMKGIILVMRARGYIDLGKYVEAFKDCTAALPLCPDRNDAYYHMAEVYLYQGDYSSAIHTLNGILQGNPQYAGAQYLRGTIKELLGDLMGALADFKSEMKISPGRVPELEAKIDGIRARLN